MGTKVNKMTSKEFIANQLKELEATRDYLKSNGKDVKAIDEAIENYKQVLKDLEILEALKDNSNIVIDGDDRYFMTRIKEYDYLRRPIDDFDKVKKLIEK